MCLCDSAMASASLLCPAGIAFGVLVILMGPLAFVVISMRIIARHYRQGDMKFEWNSPPRFAELKRQVTLLCFPCAHFDKTILYDVMVMMDRFAY